MTQRVSLLLIAAVFAGPALAQADSGYDPGRNCRFYVMQLLPVPARCITELAGNWSMKPYIDGEFMFRNRDEWLKWRDREDYRHWKSHDYAWHAGLPPAPVAPPAPAAAPPPRLATPVPAAAALYCPPEISARVMLDRAALQGWAGPDGTLLLPLERPSRTEGGTLICTYGEGRNRITLSRPAWGRCIARADGTGFDCTP